MAPKASRNPADKSEGAKTSRTGRDKGALAGLNKRLTYTTGKAAGKNTSGLMKDAKMSDSTTSLLEIKLKGKNQSTITAFLAGGIQGTSTVNATRSPENNGSGKEPTPLKLCIENKDHCDKSVESPSEIQEINRETREKVHDLLGNGQLQAQQTDQSKQSDYKNKGKTGSPLGPTAEEDDSTNLLGSPKKCDKIMGGGKSPTNGLG
ncbi:hypothetical protein NDU88_008345 [Pleurodeles waltl]|uniref:Uncharacterized protein n=1 Tax=Pleurodeles waltl TaxID=8319 RepID=A0AAV7PRC6_PLEWA|nr:hypothetical protein NDU88_008345 [Pleurodeles waltl]